MPSAYREKRYNYKYDGDYKNKFNSELNKLKNILNKTFLEQYYNYIENTVNISLSTYTDKKINNGNIYTQITIGYSYQSKTY